MDKTTVADARIVEGAILADTGRVNVPLADGLDLGRTRYARAVLRQLNAGDILAAQEEAERLVYARDGALSLVMSPARMGREALRRRSARLVGESGESSDGPLSGVDLSRLSGRDLAALQAGTELLDSVAATTAEALRDRGRSAAGGEDDAAAGDDGSPQNRNAV